MDSKQAIELFADKLNGIHRYCTEDFYQAEAREKLFHMGSGHSILDFGCGSADLLVYYAKSFVELVGVDISPNMVSLARQRIAKFGTNNISVDRASDTEVWGLVGGKSFDVITSAGVVQYLSVEQLRAFLRAAQAHLRAGGRIAIFDAIDPRLYWLFDYGWFRDRPLSVTGVFKSLGTSLRRTAGNALRFLQRRTHPLGHFHHPHTIAEIAAAEGYSARFVSSMYYEYRYHAIFERNTARPGDNPSPSH